MRLLLKLMISIEIAAILLLPVLCIILSLERV